MSAIPRTPWVLSNQYGYKFVLSQDNEIIIGPDVFSKLGDEVCKFIVDAVNSKADEPHS